MTLAELDELLALLRQNLPTRLHVWQPVLVVAGACCGSARPDPAELLGHLTGQPLTLNSANDGLRAVTLATQLCAAVADELAAGTPLLTPRGEPTPGRQHALALAAALFGFADGLDFAGVDPDTLPAPALAAFERLGQRAAALELLAEDLPDAIDDPEVAEEMRALVVATDADVATLFQALQGLRGKPN